MIRKKKSTKNKRVYISVNSVVVCRSLPCTEHVLLNPINCVEPTVGLCLGLGESVAVVWIHQQFGNHTLCLELTIPGNALRRWYASIDIAN